MSSDSDHNICFDRKLFQPYNDDPNDHDNHYHFLWNDLVGAVVWFLTAGISISCGVGGGGIYVPLGILIFQFAPKQSSGFSQACIFGAALAGLILNSQNCHPASDIRHDAGVPQEARPLAHQRSISRAEQDEYVAKGGKLYTRPLIHYDMALFMSPMQMAGAVLGVLVQKMLPNWLYLLFAGVVLSYTSYRTYLKYFAARKKEKEQLQENQDQGKPTLDEEETSGDDPDNQTQPEDSSALRPLEEGLGETDKNSKDKSDAQPQGDEQDEKLALRTQYLEADMRQYPKEKIGAMVGLWVGLFVLTLLKGGKGVESLLGIQCDSPWYYVVIACQFVWLFGFAAYFGHRLMVDQQERIAVGYPYLGEADPVWDAPAIRFYGGFCFLSGVVAALIGIGGGMVLGPLMLVMGVDPRVSTATNSTMIVVTSSSIAVMFVTSGLVPWSYALFYFGVTFSGAWIGKSRIDQYVKKTGKASILIFILASIIAFATIGCLVILVTRLVDQGWCFHDFQPFCDVNSEEDCPVNRMLSKIY